MSVIDTLITDRSESDVARLNYLNSLGWDNMTASQRTQWIVGKGSYNATDLNRVTEAMEFLARRFSDFGYAFDLIQVKDSPWEINDIPTRKNMEDYLTNVQNLRSFFTLLSTTPETPEDMVGLTYEEANDIEKILFDVDYIIQKLIEGMWYSNSFMFYSGHIPLPGNLAEYVLADNAGVILVSSDNCIFIAR